MWLNASRPSSGGRGLLTKNDSTSNATAFAAPFTTSSPRALFSPYLQRWSPLLHRLQAGLPSSHLILRSLHSPQPPLDFLYSLACCPVFMPHTSSERIGAQNCLTRKRLLPPLERVINAQLHVVSVHQRLSADQIRCRANLPRIIQVPITSQASISRSAFSPSKTARTTDAIVRNSYLCIRLLWGCN